MKNSTLEQKVKELVSGDNSSFNYIYDNTYKLLYMVIYGIVRNKMQAEDLLQDTYRVIYQNISGYKSSNFIAWATTIAKNLALNSYNRHKKETLTDFNEDNGYDKLAQEENEYNGLFDKAKEILEDEDYKILVMIIVSGYKRREISQILDMPISTVSHRYKMALKALEKYVKESR